MEVPKVGALPDYDVTPDVGVTIMDDEGSVIKNGITWYDCTAGEFLKPTDPFVEGHQYSISMYLESKSGYLFYDDENGGCLTKSSVNGAAAQAINSMGSTPNRMYFEYIFPPAKGDTPLKITTQPKDVVAASGAKATATLP